ncbi:hypothetical protein JOC77_001009 [Peribacillus deserti]|uniref:AI-2E family transporter n=1 Tax=Peribacillus deserti TaxID=673318 RepID=A0ABS2QET6_9BACI|nr:hypothetical protein [Peribacillus deserti]MBM7691602.1 hypothetical protein [Peribacillus deserti]
MKKILQILFPPRKEQVRLSDVLAFMFSFLLFYLIGLNWTNKNFLWVVPAILFLLIAQAVLEPLFKTLLKRKNIAVKRVYFGILVGIVVFTALRFN